MKKSVIVFIMAFVLFVGLTHSVVTIEAASPVDTMSTPIDYSQQYGFAVGIASIIKLIVVPFLVFCGCKLVLNEAKYLKAKAKNTQKEAQMAYNSGNSNYRKKYARSSKKAYASSGNTFGNAAINCGFADSTDINGNGIPDYTEVPSFFE